MRRNVYIDIDGGHEKYQGGNQYWYEGGHFSIDTKCPGVSLAHDTGFSGTDKITSNPALSLTGIETGATVEYSLDNGTTWSTTYTPGGDGNKTLQVRQINAVGNISGATTLNFTLDSTAPGLVVAGPQTIAASQPFTLTDLGVFSDPGCNDASGNPATGQTFAYAIDWGDGTQTSTGTARIDTLGGAGALTRGSFDGSHTYSQSGRYGVTVTVSDASGCQSTRTMQVRGGRSPGCLGLLEDCDAERGARFCVA